jgi:hypothetical protein
VCIRVIASLPLLYPPTPAKLPGDAMYAEPYYECVHTVVALHFQFWPGTFARVYACRRYLTFAVPPNTRQAAG